MDWNIFKPNPKPLRHRGARELIILSGLMEYAPYPKDAFERRIGWAEIQLDRLQERNPDLWEVLNETMQPRDIPSVIADAVWGPRKARVVRENPIREYRGWTIELVEVTQLGYRIREGRDPGRGRKMKGYELRGPDGATKFVDSLKEARRYIDDYMGAP